MMAQESLKAEKRSEGEIEAAAKALMEDLTEGDASAKLDTAVEEAAASSTSPAST